MSASHAARHALDSPPSPPSPQWRRRVAHAFSRAARDYARLASAQLAMGEVLWERLPAPAPITPLGTPWRVLDLGCGPGHWSERLAERFGDDATVIGLDLAPGMLAAARHDHGSDPRLRWVCADAAALPLADVSLDLVFSNLAIQWCPDLSRVLSELHRVLRPGGRALINTLAPGTLAEVGHAWSRPGSPAALLPLLGREQHLAAARLAGFRRVNVERQTRRFHYPDLAAVMASIKGVGAQTARPGARLTRADLARARRRFDALREPEGLPVSYRLLTLDLTRD
ncbi:methyltransferase domain-containing protein [Halomonas alkalicola]|uniref:Malonyl-[acyl-carrier protein] O-methyltransferase n=1 Tax=Halomonas alkalicola TaxID=1930622 RepID=A0ABY9H526_9GAMM|nr:methyltransferase domain-containing protein [Halomonas alkalicola]WLI73257.1 methyltransferase domain-containing protein [Halomonas alkalicola]